MKIANIIIAHKNPKQLERMIHSLRHESFYHYIHLDKKANIEEFIHLADLPRVKFLEKRYSVNWAGFRGVQATLDGFKEAIGSGLDFDYINLMTGQDYPIKPVDSFVSFLEKNPGKDYFEYDHVETGWTESPHRYKRYHLVELTIKGRYRLEDLITFILPKRKTIKGYEMYGRSAYFTITIDCAKFVLDYLKHNPDYISYFKMVWGSDELFFQTILMNCEWKNRIVKDNLRMIDWKPNHANPNIFKTEDFDRLVSSHCFLARKFDINIDSKILDLLDNHIEKS